MKNVIFLWRMYQNFSPQAQKEFHYLSNAGCPAFSNSFLACSLINWFHLTFYTRKPWIQFHYSPCAMTLKGKKIIHCPHFTVQGSQGRNEDKLSTRESRLSSTITIFHSSSQLCNVMSICIEIFILKKRKQLFAVGNCSKSFRFPSLTGYTIEKSRNFITNMEHCVWQQFPQILT